jgi:hypothetical protein
MILKLLNFNQCLYKFTFTLNKRAVIFNRFFYVQKTRNAFL